jgi:hypothetical protein
LYVSLIPILSCSVSRRHRQRCDLPSASFYPCLFYDAERSSDVVGVIVTTVGWLKSDEFQRICKQAVVAQSRYYFGAYLKVSKKFTKMLLVTFMIRPRASRFRSWNLPLKQPARFHKVKLAVCYRLITSYYLMRPAAQSCWQHIRKREI